MAYDRRTIRAGLKAAECDGNSVGNIDTLMEYIDRAAKGEVDSDEVMHAGFKLVRKTGAEMGRRGRPKNFTGWEIVDPRTGQVVSSFPPNADGGVALPTVKAIAATKRKIINLEKTKTELKREVAT